MVLWASGRADWSAGAEFAPDRVVLSILRSGPDPLIHVALPIFVDHTTPMPLSSYSHAGMPIHEQTYRQGARKRKKAYTY